MSSLSLTLPFPQLPRPTIAAWTLSALVHAALLAFLAGAAAPRWTTSAASNDIDVMLVTTLPAGVRLTTIQTARTATAALPAAPESAPPAATESAPAEAFVEARHDVAALNNPKPPYPLAARRQGIAGRVVLRVHVLADGSCDDVQIARGSGSALLDDSALSTVRRWRFLPARRGDRPVATTVEVPISFHLDSPPGTAALASAPAGR